MMKKKKSNRHSERTDVTSMTERRGVGFLWVVACIVRG